MARFSAPPPPHDALVGLPPAPLDAPPPPVASALLIGKNCQHCKDLLSIESPNLQCGLCLTCRFTIGDPFRKGRLLAWIPLQTGHTKALDIKYESFLDGMSRSLPFGHQLEVRCMRVDASDWRHELTHSWPSGISLFVGDERVLKKTPDEETHENPGPLDISKWASPGPMACAIPWLKVSAAISAKKSEHWSLGVLLVAVSEASKQVELIFRQVVERQAPLESRMQFGLDIVRLWVNIHRPDRVSKKDQLRCVEPPVLKLIDCMSLVRIEIAARGSNCEHLQCFDLRSYLHTMRSTPPKHAWCCPICDKPAPVHQLRLDAFAQSVIDTSAGNVVEVLVADDGKWEVSATEDAVADDSSDECPLPAPPTMAQLQEAALNLGRPAFTPKAPVQAKPKLNRGRSRSPKATISQEKKHDVVENAPQDKMKAWRKLQGISVGIEADESQTPSNVTPVAAQLSKESLPCLPEGWEMRKSRTTGKVYYCNAKLSISQFEPPTMNQSHMLLAALDAEVAAHNEPVSTAQQERIQEMDIDREEIEDYEEALDAQLAASKVMPDFPDLLRTTNVELREGDEGQNDAQMIDSDVALTPSDLHPGGKHASSDKSDDDHEVKSIAFEVPCTSPEPIIKSISPNANEEASILFEQQSNIKVGANDCWVMEGGNDDDYDDVWI